MSLKKKLSNLFAKKKKRRSIDHSSQSPSTPDLYSVNRNSIDIENVNNNQSTVTTMHITSNTTDVSLSDHSPLPLQQNLTEHSNSSNDDDNISANVERSSNTVLVTRTDNEHIRDTKVTQIRKSHSKVKDMFHKRSCSVLYSEMSSSQQSTDNPANIPTSSSIIDITPTPSPSLQNATVKEEDQENLSKVWSFIADPSKHSASDINTVLNMLRHEDVVSLHCNYGYNKCNLFFCVLLRFVSGLSFNEDHSLLSSYTDLIDRRIRDTDLFNAIEDRYEEILSLKKKLKGLLKEKICNYLLCAQCHQNMVSVMFLPCGHLVLCDKCNESGHERCGVCKATVSECHHVFL